MKFSIEKLSPQDAEQLYQFELENRHFFEKMVPSRGEDYFQWETFQERHSSLLEEQASGESHFYLLKEGDVILGRLNLTIDLETKTGDLGYRVGESFTGKGVAVGALKLLLENVNRKDVERINARTTSNNIASQKVLEKNGFVRMGEGESFEMNGENVTFIHFTWQNI
ncbi:GNAT family N-acetyltransferase [Halalkalibacillus sediminis]|uniref:GNAT family N-acetyltransferase n=1 Tax=Halalkalibacillus sediminis TaxID=2018042 RepID=A0A2I0QRP7_9BACI|nr:GNAT family N-acetyltransferase [Halalkalibacillus sediminis]PKR76750.1 GNAT family N-acetyltransferase [Halalkalibacillus sediminis]